MTAPAPGRGVPMVGMPEAAVRSRLAADRSAAAERLADLERSFADVVQAAADSNGDDEHDPEGATIAVERQQLSALAEAARRALVDVDAAVARLDAGTYGSCTLCARPIGDPRLDARPTAALCIRCATGSSAR